MYIKQLSPIALLLSVGYANPNPAGNVVEQYSLTAFSRCYIFVYKPYKHKAHRGVTLPQERRGRHPVGPPSSTDAAREVRYELCSHQHSPCYVKRCYVTSCDVHGAWNEVLL